MFFKEFPVIPYQFNIAGKNTLRMVRDITKSIKISKEFMDQLEYYSEYDIQDGETIERIAEKLYGNANYHWLLMLANDRFDYSKDFPLSNDALLEYVVDKYGKENVNSQHQLFGRPHFETQQGHVVYGYHLDTITIKSGGVGYPDNTEIIFSESETGITTRAELVIESGVIKDIVILEKGSGYIVPPTYTLSIVSAQPADIILTHPDYTVITNYEYEFRLNEAKRKIKIINPRSINQMVDDLKELL
jgi:hypothetical protein